MLSRRLACVHQASTPPLVETDHRDAAAPLPLATIAPWVLPPRWRVCYPGSRTCQPLRQDQVPVDKGTASFQCFSVLPLAARAVRHLMPAPVFPPPAPLPLPRSAWPAARGCRSTPRTTSSTTRAPPRRRRDTPAAALGPPPQVRGVRGCGGCGGCGGRGPRLAPVHAPARLVQHLVYLLGCLGPDALRSCC